MSCKRAALRDGRGGVTCSKGPEVSLEPRAAAARTNAPDNNSSAVNASVLNKYTIVQHNTIQ